MNNLFQWRVFPNLIFYSYSFLLCLLFNTKKLSDWKLLWIQKEIWLGSVVYYFDIVGSKYLLHPLYREWLAWRKCSCSTGWKLSSLFLVLQVLHSGLHAVPRQPAALCSVVPCILEYYTAIRIIFIVLIEVVIQLLQLLLLWRHQVPARCKNNSTNRPMTRILEILI